MTATHPTGNSAGRLFRDDEWAEHRDTAVKSFETAGPYVIRVLGLNDGRATPFDGQWVREYDPCRPGVDSRGVPMTAHLVTVPDPDAALHFPDGMQAFELWRTTSRRRRSDGQPDRPLMAFTCVVEPLTEAREERGSR